MCDGQFVANSADRGKLGGEDLASAYDLAAIRWQSSSRWQPSAPKGILPHPPAISAWDSFDTSPSRSLEKHCQRPHAVESEGGRPWNNFAWNPFPSHRMVVCPYVMIVIFVKYIE